MRLWKSACLFDLKAEEEEGEKKKEEEMEKIFHHRLEQKYCIEITKSLDRLTVQV